MEFKELENLLTNGKYNLLSAHLQHFCDRLQSIYMYGIGALSDCVTTTKELMMQQNEAHPGVITRNSVLGTKLSM